MLQTINSDEWQRWNSKHKWQQAQMRQAGMAEDTIETKIDVSLDVEDRGDRKVC